MKTQKNRPLCFEYNEDGLRQKKTVNNVDTDYFYNGSLLLSLVQGSNTLLFSYDAKGKVSAVRFNGTYYYYLRNGQGDIVKLIDNNGNTVAEYAYDTWGKQLSCTGSLASTLGVLNPFRYRGYVYDEETQWYYLQSRYYDPTTGRFLSADVMLSTGQGVLGHNTYAYCLNNPVSMSDAAGTDPTVIEELEGLVGAFVALCLLLGINISETLPDSSLIQKIVKNAEERQKRQQALAYIALSSLLVVTRYTVNSIEEKLETKSKNNVKAHTVYFLIDESGNVQYVGRTTNSSARERAHKANPFRAHLTFVPYRSNLSAEQARGLEQILMIQYHTLNKKDMTNNQINGISPNNSLLAKYMAAGRAILQYADNFVTNEALYWTGR